MSYTRCVACPFGAAYAGALTHAGYALDGDTAWTPATEKLDPVGDPTGGVAPLVTFPDGYAGSLIFCPDTTATPKRYSFVAVNPGDDERTDAAVGSRLAPTVPGRTLDVSAAGEAGIDWANVGSPTTTVGLTGTTVSASQVAASVTAAVTVGTINAAASNTKKNTALAGFTFVMTDSTNHAPTPALTVTATRSLDGAAFAACANAASAVSSGVYKIDLAAADMNANVVILRFVATGADDRFVTIITQP